MSIGEWFRKKPPAPPSPEDAKRAANRVREKYADFQKILTLKHRVSSK